MFRVLPPNFQCIAFLWFYCNNLLHKRYLGHSFSGFKMAHFLHIFNYDRTTPRA